MWRTYGSAHSMSERVWKRPQHAGCAFISARSKRRERATVRAPPPTHRSLLGSFFSPGVVPAPEYPETPNTCGTDPARQRSPSPCLPWSRGSSAICAPVA